MTNFYPRPPRGGRQGELYTPQSIDLFLSTPSARRATARPGYPAQYAWHFYPRPPRGGRLARRADALAYERISIHALREEGDGWATRNTPAMWPISIHALREEGDVVVVGGIVDNENFYPRPPRGGRPAPGHKSADRFLFLSTPSARRATSRSPWAIRPARFLSTPSARRATCVSVTVGFGSTFLSTPSARRATAGFSLMNKTGLISIHALREEGDAYNLRKSGRYLISIHALREEGDPF